MSAVVKELFQASSAKQPSGERQTNGRREKSSAEDHKREMAKNEHRIGEEGANEEMEDDVMDVVSQVNFLLSVQLESRARDMEAATCCTLLILRGSAIVTGMQSVSRAYDELVTSQPSVERGSPHIWFVTAQLWETENVVAFPDHAEEFFDSENEWNELHDELESEEDPWASMGMDDAEETLPKDQRPAKDAAADRTPGQDQEEQRFRRRAASRRESRAKDEMGLSSGCSEPRPLQMKLRIAHVILTFLAEAALENALIQKAMAAMGIAQNLEEEENVIVAEEADQRRCKQGWGK